MLLKPKVLSKRAQDFGFENLSIDLIYGSPTSNFEIWKEKKRKP